MKQTPAHVIISWVFLIIIGVGFAYSYFFYPNAHPISCLVKAYTGRDCPACGFSRAFSHYTHLQFGAGKAANPLSWAVFLFFAWQAVVRAAVILHYYITRRLLSYRLIIWDSIISISFFLLAFLPVITKF